jgi:hypothetical protein
VNRPDLSTHDPELPGEREVEPILRAYFDRLEAEVDAEGVLAKVRQRLDTAPRRNRPWRAPVWILATAAGLLVAAGSWLASPSPRPVRADALVRQVVEAQSASVDRLYHSRVAIRPGVMETHPGLRLVEGSHSEIWTRGDRFWAQCETRGVAFAWGRDDQGRIWVAPNRQVGLIYEPGEVPDSFVLAAELLSLRPEGLLSEMLQSFDLVNEPARSDDGPHLRRVRATPRPGGSYPRLLAATLEIDTQARLVRKLTLTRGLKGKPLADVVFTLVDASPQPDQTYTLEGHLDPDAARFDSQRPFRRRQQLLRHLPFVPGMA